MPVLLFIIVGAAAGFIATRLMKVETDIATTIAIGVIGAVVAGIAVRLLASLAGAAAAFVAAIAGAMLLIWLWRRYGPRR